LHRQHRVRHQHQFQLAVGVNQRVDIGRGRAAIGAIEVVKLPERDVAAQIADGDLARQFFETRQQRRVQIEIRHHVVGLDRVTAGVGLHRGRGQQHEHEGEDQAREAGHCRFFLLV